MKKYVFFSLPSQGHLNPTYIIVRELVRKGNTVFCYTTPEFQKNIEAEGGIYRPYPYNEVLDLRIGRNLVAITAKLIKLTETNLPQILAETSDLQPDCILHDSLALWGKIAAARRGIPAVSLITTLVATTAVLWRYPKLFPLILNTVGRNWQKIGLVNSQYRRLLMENKIPVGDYFDPLVNREKLNLVFTSRLFQPAGESFDESFVFVGPAIYNRQQGQNLGQRLNSKDILIYISMGTVYTDDLPFYRMCLAAFRNTPYQVILSLGERFGPADLPDIPPNFTVKNYVPQLDILSRARLFISHGGMNSVQESLYFGVPLLIVPQMDEQRLNAIRTSDLGAGVYVRRQGLTAAKLQSLARQILEEPRFLAGAKIIQTSLTTAGGWPKAVASIENYVNSLSRS